MKSDHSRLEAFLGEIEDALEAVPLELRKENLTETRSHLEAMLAARRSDGLSEGAAWESVKWAFGEPRAIGEALSKEWQRAPRYSEEKNAELDRKARAIHFTIILWLAVFYIAFTNLPSGTLSSSTLSSVAILVIPVLVVAQTISLRFSRASITPYRIKAFALSCGAILTMGLGLIFEGKSTGFFTVEWSTTLFATTVFLSCMTILMWEHRELRKRMAKNHNYATSALRGTT